MSANPNLDSCQEEEDDSSDVQNGAAHRSDFLKSAMKNTATMMKLRRRSFAKKVVKLDPLWKPVLRAFRSCIRRHLGHIINSKIAKEGN